MNTLNLSDKRFKQLFIPDAKALVYVQIAQLTGRVAQFWVADPAKIETRIYHGQPNYIAHVLPVLLGNPGTNARRVKERSTLLGITPEEYIHICNYCRGYKAILA